MSDVTPLHRRTTPERSSSSAGTNAQSMSFAATSALAAAKLRKFSRKGSRDLNHRGSASSNASQPQPRLPPRPVSQPHPDRMYKEDMSRTAGVATTMKHAGNASNLTESVPQSRYPLDDLVHSLQVDVDREQLLRVSNSTNGQDENGEPRSLSPRSTMRSRAKKSSAELDIEFQKVFENLAPAPDKPDIKRSTVRRKPTGVEAVYFDLVTFETQGTENYNGEAKSSTPSPLARAKRRQTRLSTIDGFPIGPRAGGDAGHADRSDALTKQFFCEEKNIGQIS